MGSRKRDEGLPSERAMESSDDVAALFANSRDVTANGTECFGAIQSTEGARDFLFELDHADIALSQIVVEGDIEVVHESESAILVLIESVKKILGRSLFGSAPFLGRWLLRCGIELESLLENGIVFGLEVS